MKILTSLLTLIFLATAPLAFACDCESQGNFLTVAPKSKLVALVKVKSYLSYKDIYDQPMPMSMEVEIIEVYQGQETRKTITVWGDNGRQCRPYLNKFNVGDFYVIAFKQDSEENPRDYAISSCGDFWLSADNEKKIASGPIGEDQKEISLEDLREYFIGDK